MARGETLDAEGNAFVGAAPNSTTPDSQGLTAPVYVGTSSTTSRCRSSALRMTLKRVNLLNCNAARPSVQLFI